MAGSSAQRHDNIMGRSSAIGDDKQQADSLVGQVITEPAPRPGGNKLGRPMGPVATALLQLLDWISPVIRAYGDACGPCSHTSAVQRAHRELPRGRGWSAVCSAPGSPRTKSQSAFVRAKPPRAARQWPLGRTAARSESDLTALPAAPGWASSRPAGSALVRGARGEPALLHADTGARDALRSARRRTM